MKGKAMDTNEYIDVFGSDEGENTQETAEPAPDTGDEGENDQLVAEADGEAAEDADGASSDEKTAPNTKNESNAKYAAARRKAEAERDAAVAKAKADADAYISDVVKSLGIIDPTTGKPVTTKDEFERMKTARLEMQKKDFMQKAGMTDTQFGDFIGSLPEVKAAREAEKAAKAAEAKTMIDGELKEITKLDPNITSLADLAKLDTYPQIYEMTKRGYKLLDAYRLANFDAISGKTSAAAKQQALNSVAGRSQMTRVQSRGTGAVSVPADVMQMYRDLNPDATDAEIAKHYNKSKR